MMPGLGLDHHRIAGAVVRTGERHLFARSGVIEQVFNLPGIGRMLATDVGARDLMMVQGELLVLTGLVLLIGFVVDLVHHAIDPRQREAA